MTAEEAVEIARLFEQNHIEMFVDGGWAVDALLGEQSRSHADLDVAIQHKDVPRVRALFGAMGFQEAPREGSWECNFVLEDASGRQIDVHSYTHDPTGKHVYGVVYPLDSLRGRGSINGYAVKCITPERLVKFHTGYKPDEDDYHDVKLLCRRFGLAPPQEYEHFERRDCETQSGVVVE